MTRLIHYSIFWFGYQLFKITKKTLNYPYYSFRKLFVMTRGRINDQLTDRIGRKTGMYSLPQTSGVLGALTESDIKAIVDNIRRDGYYIFQPALDAQRIQKLVEFASVTEAQLMPAGKGGEKSAIYDAKNPLSSKYNFSETTLMSNPTVLELATDMSLMAVAQAYLGAKPIQDLTAMWWSTAFSKKASDAAAQLYHFDMDRIKFLKFFFYLTDVTTDTGPHCYVRGSHVAMPEALWKDGRILDEEMHGFQQEDFKEIVGKRGTIIAVDTRGLHKGKPLVTGDRLILQYEFTNSLFGASYEHIDLPATIDPKFKKVFESFPYTFSRFNW